MKLCLFVELFKWFRVEIITWNTFKNIWIHIFKCQGCCCFVVLRLISLIVWDEILLFSLLFPNKESMITSIKYNILITLHATRWLGDSDHLPRPLPGRLVSSENEQIKNWNNVSVSASLEPFDSWRFALAPPLSLLWVRRGEEIGDASRYRVTFICQFTGY